MKILLGATLVLVAALSKTVHAEDVAVYESLSQVSVGRVFFSVSERERLDTMRGRHSGSKLGQRSKANVPRPKADASAAGYFVDANGKAWVYRGGDFVAVDSRPVVAFHDDVPIRKTAATDRVAERDDDTSD